MMLPSIRINRIPRSIPSRSDINISLSHSYSFPLSFIIGENIPRERASLCFISPSISRYSYSVAPLPSQSPSNSSPSPAPSQANLFIVPVELCMIHASLFTICAGCILARIRLSAMVRDLDTFRDESGDSRILPAQSSQQPESREFHCCKFPGATILGISTL